VIGESIRRGPRILGLAAALILFTLAACAQSDVDPEADIALGGTVIRQGGGTASDVGVVLTREPDLVEILLTGAMAGLPCLDPDPPAICKGARIEKTAGDGTFTFNLKGSDTQSSLGTAATMGLATRLSRSGDQLEGAGVAYRLQVQTEQLRVPLRIWQPEVDASADPRRARVTFSGLSPTLLPQDADLSRISSHVRFEARGGQLVWILTNFPSGGEFDTRLLEDTRGSLAVFAEVDDVDVDDAEGRKLDIIFRSARLPYASPAGRPVSRGKGCFAYDQNGTPFATSPCRLTDGNFEESFDSRCPQGDCPSSRQAYLDLGGPTTITFVVVRGCGSRCTIEVSDDALNWRPVGVGQSEVDLGEGADNFGLTPPSPTTGSFVRVTSENLLIDSLREVSVWDDSPPAEPARAPGSSLLVPRSDEAVTDGEVDTDAGPSRILRIVAAVSVVVLAVLVAYSLARRRVRRA
jgi:hypothetical protein